MRAPTRARSLLRCELASLVSTDALQDGDDDDDE